MKNYPWILLSGGLLALAFAPGACGSDGSGGNTGGASSSSSSTTSSTSTTSSSGGGSAGSSSSSTGTGGGPSCAGALQGACGTCMEGACCAQLAACKGDANCITCLTSSVPDPALCDVEPTKSVYQAARACAEASCDMQCFAQSLCNPVTNEGCTEPGSACDIDATTNVFKCFPPTNDAPLCGSCSNTAVGPFCAGTMHCNTDENGLNGQCSKFCCDDGDCGSGTCDKMVTGGVSNVGICVPKPGADAGSPVAVCDAPATAPSNGSCYVP